MGGDCSKPGEVEEQLVGSWVPTRLDEWQNCPVPIQDRLQTYRYDVSRDGSWVDGLSPRHRGQVQPVSPGQYHGYGKEPGKYKADWTLQGDGVLRMSWGGGHARVPPGQAAGRPTRRGAGTGGAGGWWRQRRTRGGGGRGRGGRCSVPQGGREVAGGGAGAAARPCDAHTPAFRSLSRGATATPSYHGPSRVMPRALPCGPCPQADGEAMESPGEQSLMLAAGLLYHEVLALVDATIAGPSRSDTRARARVRCHHGLPLRSRRSVLPTATAAHTRTAHTHQHTHTPCHPAQRVCDVSDG